MLKRDYLIVMSVSIPIAIILGLDAWINFFLNQTSSFYMLILPVFLTIAVVCLIKIKSIEKSSKK